MVLRSLLVPVAALATAIACGGSASTTTSTTTDAGSCPENQSPTQNVVFRFQPGTQVKYVAVASTFCSAFTLTQGGTSFLTTRPFECGCECAGPSAHVDRLVKADGTFTWPATTLTTCTLPLNCGQGLGLSTQRSFPAQRVTPGSYRMTFVTYAALPAGCVDAGDAIPCSVSGSGVASTSPSSCPGDGFVSVDFVVPASGDVTVDVPLP